MEWGSSTLPDWGISLKPGNKAVIFVHYLNELDEMSREEYAHMDAETLRVASSLPGYLGYEFSQTPMGTIFISYWEDSDAVTRWAHHPLHREAKEQGRAVWYAEHRSLICTIDRVMGS